MTALAIDDQSFFWLTACVALIFSILTWYLPTHGVHSLNGSLDDVSQLESTMRMGVLLAQIRMIFFPLVAGIFWIILGGMTAVSSYALAFPLDFGYAAVGIIYLILAIIFAVVQWASQIWSTSSRLRFKGEVR